MSVHPSSSPHGSELTARQAQDALALMAQSINGEQGDSTLRYLVISSLYQAGASIAANLKSQFSGVSVEPGRLPHDPGQNTMGHEAGLGAGAEASVEAHPALVDSVQHDGIAPDNPHDNAVIHDSEITREKLETIPVNQLTPELQNKLSKTATPVHSSVPSPSPFK